MDLLTGEKIEPNTFTIDMLELLTEARAERTATREVMVTLTAHRARDRVVIAAQLDRYHAAQLLGDLAHALGLTEIVRDHIYLDGLHLSRSDGGALLDGLTDSTLKGRTP